MRLRIIISLVLFVILFVCEHMGVLEPLPWWAQLLIFAVPYLIVGYDIIFKAARNISHGQIFDENFLMMIATFGAFGVGEYLEAVAVMLFYQVGELFQGYAVGKSRQSITEMMDICPEYANVEEDGKLVTVDPDDVEVGTIIVVKPGERIPLDGVVIEGESLIDTAALTGESVPRRASEGDEIISGCVNGSGNQRHICDKRARLAVRRILPERHEIVMQAVKRQRWRISSPDLPNTIRRSLRLEQFCLL